MGWRNVLKWVNEMAEGNTSDKTAPQGLRMHRMLGWTRSLAASGLAMTLKVLNLDLKEPEGRETLVAAAYLKTDNSFSSKADGDHVKGQGGHHLMQTNKNQKGFHRGKISLKERQNPRETQFLLFVYFAQDRLQHRWQACYRRKYQK